MEFYAFYVSKKTFQCSFQTISVNCGTSLLRTFKNVQLFPQFKSFFDESLTHLKLQFIMDWKIQICQNSNSNYDLIYDKISL